MFLFLYRSIGFYKEKSFKYAANKYSYKESVLENFTVVF
jgi:hypothetical protein